MEAHQPDTDLRVVFQDLQATCQPCDGSWALMTPGWDQSWEMAISRATQWTDLQFAGWCWYQLTRVAEMANPDRPGTGVRMPGWGKLLKILKTLESQQPRARIVGFLRDLVECYHVIRGQHPRVTIGCSEQVLANSLVAGLLNDLPPVDSPDRERLIKRYAPRY